MKAHRSTPSRLALVVAALVASSYATGCEDEPALPDAAVRDASVADSSVADGATTDSGSDAGTDAGTDAGSDAGPPCDGPPGLYAPGSCSVLAEGVRRFAPQYPLWSDGAAKERFVLIPTGTTIDTSDPDAWVFPVGTTFWKTFSRDGLRIETRILVKETAGVGPDQWSMQTFAWSEDQMSVAEAIDGVVDALGTTHDIPPATSCVRCHNNAAVDVGMGFSAIQLNHEDGNETSLEDLNLGDFLTADIALSDAVIPGDVVTRDALGYMHSNCGGCHGGPRPLPRLDPLVLWIDVGVTDVTTTGPYVTAVSHPSSWPGTLPPIDRVEPGDADTSSVLLRMETRDLKEQMPPLASEIPDTAGIASVRAWIDSL